MSPFANGLLVLVALVASVLLFWLPLAWVVFG